MSTTPLNTEVVKWKSSMRHFWMSQTIWTWGSRPHLMPIPSLMLHLGKEKKLGKLPRGKMVDKDCCESYKLPNTSIKNNSAG